MDEKHKFSDIHFVHFTLYFICSKLILPWYSSSYPFCNILLLIYHALFFFTDDLSYNKLAYQTHTYVGTYYAAVNAVDRNSTTCTRTRGIGSNSPDKTMLWKVDLGGVYSIHSVTIIFKNYDLWSGI